MVQQKQSHTYVGPPGNKIKAGLHTYLFYFFAGVLCRLCLTLPQLYTTIIELRVLLARMTPVGISSFSSESHDHPLSLS